jgi:hypothetical protein
MTHTPTPPPHPMSTVPNHTPTMDEGSGVVSWTDPDGRRHNLHTDPAEAAAFFARSSALAAGREDLRMILNASAFWLEAVTDAGLPPAEAVEFLAARVGREVEQLIRLLVDGRLGAYVEQLLSEVADPDAGEVG